MFSKSNKRPLVAATVVMLFVGGVGCELVADFDRTKIDAGASPSTDAGVVDQTSPRPDTGAGDSATTPDAAGTDTGVVPVADAQPDALETGSSADAGADARDGASDAADTGSNPGSDAATDADASGPDAAPDATGTDASLDAELG